MEVFQVKIKIFVKKDINIDDIQATVSSFIDKGLSKNKKFLDFHDQNEFKNYCFDAPFPIEKDKVYKKDNIYTLTIRTIDCDLAKYFINNLVNEYSDEIKGLTGEIRIIPKKFIEKIYSITPIILKTDNGYWKGEISLEEFEKRIKANLIKKYNNIMGTKINEDFLFYTSIKFKNSKPIATKYKQIKLLGDKIELNISEDKMAQELAYMCLGTGLAEINARGYGFMNFRWL